LAEIGECKCIYAAITVSVEHELLMWWLMPHYAISKGDNI
jgi:hypothetical protein